MIEIKSRLKGVTDKETWASHGASFMAKAKATKVVWFPPTSVETGKEAASTAKEGTRTTTKKASGTAKKTTNPARRTKR